MKNPHVFMVGAALVSGCSGLRSCDIVVWYSMHLGFLVAEFVLLPAPYSVQAGSGLASYAGRGRTTGLPSPTGRGTPLASRNLFILLLKKGEVVLKVDKMGREGMRFNSGSF